MSTLAVVERIMRETQEPMSVRDIVEAAGEALPTRSKTPDTVVARDLSMDIKRKGEDSTFIRTSPGRYTIREFVANGRIAMGAVSTSAMTSDSSTQSSDTTSLLGNAMSGERSPTRHATSSDERQQRRAPTEDTASA
jgi:hypothetical protein